MGLDLGTVDGHEHIAIRLPNSFRPNEDGLQGAHIFGQQYWSRGLLALRNLFDPNNILDVDHRRNGFLAPETKAGSMALGVNVHNNRQQGAYDALAYDKDNPATSNQFLNAGLHPSGETRLIQ